MCVVWSCVCMLWCVATWLLVCAVCVCGPGLCAECAWLCAWVWYSPCALLRRPLAGGNLFDVVSERHRRGAPFPERTVWDLFLPTCRAVAYLHSLAPPVAHRDIKVGVWHWL